MNLREELNLVYQRVRKTEQGIDSRMDPLDLLGFVGRKSGARLRGIVRGRFDSFFGSNVEILGRRHLTVGKSLVVGANCLLDCVGEEGIRLGDNVTIDRFATLRVSGVVRNLGVGIEIGSRTSIGAFNLILGQGGVKIGDDCLFGPGVTVLSENHNMDDRRSPIRQQGEVRRAVEVGDDVWLGAKTTILGGCKIGNGAVVAAGAVVTRDVAALSVVGGVPARVISER